MKLTLQFPLSSRYTAQEEYGISDSVGCQINIIKLSNFKFLGSCQMYTGNQISIFQCFYWNVSNFFMNMNNAPMINMEEQYSNIQECRNRNDNFLKIQYKRLCLNHNVTQSSMLSTDCRNIFLNEHTNWAWYYCNILLFLRQYLNRLYGWITGEREHYYISDLLLWRVVYHKFIILQWMH
jgi:hypothetical protein